MQVLNGLALSSLIVALLTGASASASTTPPLPTKNPKRPGTIATAVTKPSAAQAQAKPAASGAGGTGATVAAPAEPKPSASPIVATSAAERSFLAEMDKAVSKARAFEVSADNLARIKTALSGLSGERSKAQAARAEISDPVAAKFVEWYWLRSGVGKASEYKSFLQNNPGWPDRPLLSQRLEEALFNENADLPTVRAMLGSDEPRTGVGHAALASAHLAAGDRANAKQAAGKAWRELRISASLEPIFLKRFGDFLEVADHKWRLDRLLVDDERWTDDRKERAVIVRRLIPLLPAGEQKKAQARLAVFLRSAGAKAAIDALPPEDKVDWGLVFHQAQMLRRAKKYEAASKLLLGAPTDPEKIVSPDDWWAERRANAYEALEGGNPKLAYALVRDAGPLTVNPKKEQAFLAGWLAMRHLNDPKSAIRHFEEMRAAADGPLSRSKSEYWTGRAAEALGDRERAEARYRDAAKVADTFHGQLAAARLKPNGHRFPVALPALPSAEQIAAFGRSDAVKAVVLIEKAGLDKALARSFIAHLSRSTMADEASSAMLAHLALSLGDTQTAVRVGKTAMGRNQNLMIYAYPTALPAYEPLRPPLEPAFLFAIARQESEFNSSIVSGAGARGLLQVMPITAKHVCRDYKIKCDIPRLLTDNAYNARIASAYIADRMDEFDGSYVLTLAGYNAGPGRARQWIRAFGDPRDPAIDPIDWIERIPFQETREYVAKVLANIQVYRARLGEDASMRIAADLQRARKSSRAAAAQ